jgi:xylulokinase
MPNSPCFLGIDVSRSSLGLVVMTATGEVAATLRRSYGGDESELSDPQDWWRAVRTGIKEILRRSHRSAANIRCIGLTGDSNGIVALNKDGKVLCQTVLGPDKRAAPFAEQLTKSVGARNLLNLASGLATSQCAAVKLMWLRQHEKRVWHDLAYVLPPKDFLRYRLSGALVTDACDAAATLLFNPKSRTWSKQLLMQLDFNPTWLPTIQGGQMISSRVTTEAARDTGLIAGTPIVTGTGHVAAAAVAVGTLAPGSAMVELGGEGSLFVPTADSVRDPLGRLQSTCHTLAGTWALCGTNLASGDSLQWLIDQIATSEVMQSRRAKRDPMELLAEMAAEVPPGADGLLFLPPGTPSGMSGFIGLQYSHCRGHLIRSVLESSALALRQAFDALNDLKKAPSQLTVTGIGAQNKLWCQMVADALDMPITALPREDLKAHGAAILASSAVGIYKTIEEACSHLVKGGTHYHARKAATDSYRTMTEKISRLTAATPSAPTSMESSHA